jgi:ubiquinone/menaquinone biosynthesis C-methylase UbiE
MSERYTHGHHPAVLAAHGARTAQNSAAFLLPHLRADHRVLDVGCGPGSITVDLAELVPQGSVVGIDAVASVLEQGRATATARRVSNVTFEPADTYSLPYPEDSFDVVYAHQVLQHVARPVEALREMRRVLRPGGLVAVRDSDYSTMIHAPHDARLDRWLELYFRVARSNGGEPNAGRFLRGWVQQAGFVNDVTTGSAWCHANAEATTTWGQTWAARVTESAFAEQAVAMGAATVAELADIADAWRTWAAKPDAFFAFVHGEVIATKA